MITSTIGFWNSKKAKLLHMYPFLTDKDVSFIEGKEKEMLEILGYKIGKSKMELISIIIAL